MSILVDNRPDATAITCRIDYAAINSAVPYAERARSPSSHRDPSLPDVPTFTEAGLRDADVTSVWSLSAPAITPIGLRRTIREVIAEVMRDPNFAKRLAKPVANTP